jgi:3-oxoacyl-[acyl-carrier protein] reductase
MANANDLDLAERVAVITGANHGIGAAIARSLAARGAGVVLTYLRLHDEVDGGESDRYRAARDANADEVVEAIRADDGRVAAIEADQVEGCESRLSAPRVAEARSRAAGQ